MWGRTYQTVDMVTKAHQNPSKTPEQNELLNSLLFSLASCA